MAAKKQRLTQREKARRAEAKKRLKQEGRTEYNFGELADKVIIPILKL